MTKRYFENLGALLAIVALLFGATSASAQVGDVCSNPFMVNGLPYMHDSTTTGYNYDYDAPCFGPNGANGAPDVVYAYTADSSGLVTVSLCHDSTAYDTKVWVFQDTCVDMAWIACNDDACANTIITDEWISEVDMYVDSGSTYYVVVGGWGANDNGNYTISLEWAASACNAPYNFVLDSLNDTLVVISWFSTNAGDTLHWEYGTEGFAPGTGTTIMQEIVGGLNMVTLTGLTPGETYDAYLVEMCDTSATDTVGPLTWQNTAPPPVNDVCAGAISIMCGDTATGTNSWATVDDADVPGGCGAGNVAVAGVWFHFMSPQDTSVTLSTCSLADFDTRISVYDGTCGNLSCVAGNDDFSGCALFTSQVTFGATANTDYYVLVHGYPGNFPTGEFDMTVTCAPPCSPEPANDDCADAIAITAVTAVGECTPVSGDNNCATAALANPDCDPFGAIADVWYMYDNQDLTTLTVGLDNFSAHNMNIALYDGCGGTLLACDTAGSPTVTATGLSAGAIYIQVWNNGGAQEGSFDLCVESDDVVGINNIAAVRNFRIQPNPASEQVIISGDADGAQGTVSLYTVRGELVKSQVVANGYGFRIEWNLDELAGGVYFVKYQSENSQSIEKLVIK